MKKTANISRKKSSMRRAKIRFIAVSLSAVAALSLSGISTRIVPTTKKQTKNLRKNRMKRMTNMI